MIRDAIALMADIREGVRAQPGRVSLSVLSISVGMAALTFLLAALGGLREKSRSLTEELGLNVLAIVSDRAKTGTGRPLDERCASLLAANLKECRVSIVRDFPPLPSDTAGPSRLMATDDNLVLVRQWVTVRGRFLDAYDLKYRARSAVMSEDLAALPGWDVGKTVRLRNVLFTIVGIVSAGGEGIAHENPAIPSFSGRRTVFVPLTTAGLWLDPRSAEVKAVDTLFVRMARGVSAEHVMDIAGHVMNAPDVACTGFSWITPEKILAGIRKLQRTILLTAGSIALMCILLGGTTLAGLMVMNVRDRVQEIGLRQALGARKSNIASLFVIEGLLLAGAGAVTGTAVSLVFITATGTMVPCPMQIGVVTALGPLLMSFVVGAIASYWPARLATSLSPADALRNE